MPRKSGELQRQAEAFGLETSGTREELMVRIRDHIVKTKQLDILPQIDPMVAHNAKDLLDYDLPKPWLSKELAPLWNHPDIIVEPKLDGIRVKAHFNPSYVFNPRLDSRRRSDVNFVFNEKTANFPCMQVDMLPESMRDMILDGELLPPPGTIRMWNPMMQVWVDNLQITTSIWNSGRETSLNMQTECQVEREVEGCGAGLVAGGCRLHYHIFDVIRFNGQWVYELPWKERHPLKVYAANILAEVNPYYHLVPSWDNSVDRIALFEAEIAKGGEGVMFKNKDYPYEIGKRVKHILKLKRFQSCDAFVTGFVPATPGKGWEGLIGAFELSVYSGDSPVHIASCSSMTFADRQAATAPDGTLKPEYYNKVAEVRFQQLTGRNVRGRHAVLVRWRDDKAPRECGYDQLQEAPSEMMDDSY